MEQSRSRKRTGRRNIPASELPPVAIMTESETVDEGIANMNEQVQALLG